MMIGAIIFFFRSFTFCLLPDSSVLRYGTILSSLSLPGCIRPASSPFQRSYRSLSPHSVSNRLSMDRIIRSRILQSLSNRQRILLRSALGSSRLALLDIYYNTINDIVKYLSFRFGARKVSRFLSAINNEPSFRAGSHRILPTILRERLSPKRNPKKQQTFSGLQLSVPLFRTAVIPFSYFHKERTAALFTASA